MNFPEISQTQPQISNSNSPIDNDFANQLNFSKLIKPNQGNIQINSVGTVNYNEKAVIPKKEQSGMKEQSLDQ